MLDITHFGLFALSVFLLSVTPGPDIAYVVGQSVVNYLCRWSSIR